ncbi:hypothetical protein DQ04_08211030 [Trypanosoma grayi]|uniref:hypothetical protein n=1 Tax=Trypanosoma grayi TaxID=71804 RepID=UPI0004F4B412|nr:hypothetical protein DQ04_08211030 [Trypanosoma grayi]KEG08014.1 hypothetical protein DQ04_08211030 [Trypanosoma grayi]
MFVRRFHAQSRNKLSAHCSVQRPPLIQRGRIYFFFLCSPRPHFYDPQAKRKNIFVKLTAATNTGGSAMVGPFLLPFYSSRLRCALGCHSGVKAKRGLNWKK